MSHNIITVEAQNFRQLASFSSLATNFHAESGIVIAESCNLKISAFASNPITTQVMIL